MIGRVRDFLPDCEDLSFSEGRIGIYPAPTSSLLHSHNTHTLVAAHSVVTKETEIHELIAVLITLHSIKTQFNIYCINLFAYTHQKRKPKSIY